MLATVLALLLGASVPRRLAREMADAIPGARYVELPGDDHMPWVGDGDQTLDVIEEFLTGAKHAGQVSRVLATVLLRTSSTPPVTPPNSGTSVGAWSSSHTTRLCASS